MVRWEAGQFLRRSEKQNCPNYVVFYTTRWEIVGMFQVGHALRHNPLKAIRKTHTFSPVLQSQTEWDSSCHSRGRITRALVVDGFVLQTRCHLDMQICRTEITRSSVLCYVHRQLPNSFSNPPDLCHSVGYCTFNPKPVVMTVALIQYKTRWKSSTNKADQRPHLTLTRCIKDGRATSELAMKA